MIGAALLSIPLRINLPVALVTTLYTNPFTIVPLYVVAYWMGSLVIPDSGPMAPPPEFSWGRILEWVRALVDWAVELGKPLGIGLVILAVSLAALGWVAVQVAWRGWVVVQWRRRKVRQAH